jgi:HPt (histidine-containing phosphotransfer) domain-containing protein
MVDGASPIDLAHFTSFTNGDQQLERELSSLYMTTADTRLDEMRQALAAGLPWDGPAHELKGASANLGAVEVAALAAEAETATPSEAQLSRLTAALDTVRHFFERRTRADREAEQAALGTENGLAPGAQPQPR